MIWKIFVQDKEKSIIRWTAQDLVKFFLQKITESSVEDSHSELIGAGSEWLMTTQSMHAMSVRELMYMGFQLGYRYRLFLEKNSLPR